MRKLTPIGIIAHFGHGAPSNACNSLSSWSDSYETLTLWASNLMGFLVVTSNWGRSIEILRVTAVWKIVQSGHGHFDMIFSKFFDEEFFNEAIRMLIYRLRACNKWNSIIQWQSHCCYFQIFRNGARRAARGSSSSLLFSIILWQIEYFDTWFLVNKTWEIHSGQNFYVIPPFS